MISVAVTIPVNPPGIEPRITRHDLWLGLEAKAMNALPFVPAMTACEMKCREGNVIERDIEVRGERHSERIVLHEPDSVEFERIAGPSRGTIRNEIVGGDDDLHLRFTFDLSIDYLEDGSEDEKRYEETMRSQYGVAVEATIGAVRQRVQAGGWTTA